MSDSVQPYRQQPTRLRSPWDSSGQNTGVGCHFPSNAWKWKVRVKSLSHIWLFMTPWTVAHQAPLSMGFSRQEYWSGVPLPSLITLYMIQQKRHWCIEQSFGLCGRGTGWDDLGEWHWNIYNIIWNELPFQVRCTTLDAWGWCTGTTQRDGTGREEGEGFRMGNTCIPVADSCW